MFRDNNWQLWVDILIAYWRILSNRVRIILYFEKSARGTFYIVSFVHIIASPTDKRSHCSLPPLTSVLGVGGREGSVRGGLGEVRKCLWGGAERGGLRCCIFR